MPKRKNRTELLIHSLTPSEKRHFQLNHSSTINNLFKQVEADKLTSTNQLIKLFHLIIDDLSLNKQNSVRTIYSQAFQKSSILFDHGLYNEGVKIVNKSLHRSIEHEFFTDALNLIGLKMYYVKNVGISKINEYEQLLELKGNLLLKLNNILTYEVIHQKLLSTIRSSMQAQNKDTVAILKKLKRKVLLKNIEKALSFKAKSYFFLCHIIISFLEHNTEHGEKYCIAFYKLFQQYPHQQKLEIRMYISNFLNLFNILLHFEKVEQYKYYKKKFDSIKVTTPELIGLKFKARLDSEIQYLLLKGTVQKVQQFSGEISRLFSKNKKHINIEYQMIYYINLSMLMLKINRADLAVDFMQQFLNINWGNTRRELQRFTELYHLCYHFANKNYQYVYNRASVIYLRQRRKFKLYKIEVTIFKFFRQHNFERIDQNQIKSHLLQLKQSLTDIIETNSEEKAFNENYFDYLWWLKKCISNI